METIMSDLLKEAIADAKAVRETALQNAKMALEEAFTPHLKSMLSAKLAEEDDEDEENPFADKDEDEEDAEDMARYEEEGDEDPNPFADEDEESEPEMEPEMEEEGIIEIDGVKYAPVVSEEDEEEMEYDAEADDSEELDLEAVIKELELEIAESDESDEDLEEEAVEETVNITEEEDEDEDEKEVDEQSTPESEEDTEVHESVNAMQTELNEYKEAVTYLRDKLHEVNILNAKLLYTNRLFKEFALSNNQKMKIVETFDRAQTTREIKLVYSTLAESYSDTGSVKKNEIKEFASKKAGTTAPKTKIISEENQVADRFKKLAGILND
jgi:hypothetical protein